VKDGESEEKESDELM